MMENDVIIYGSYALVYLVLIGMALFAGTKTVEQFKVFVPALVPPLRRFFDDPESVQVKFLEEQLRIKREIADMVAEAVANALEQIAAAQQQMARFAPEPNITLDNVVKSQNELMSAVSRLIETQIEAPPREVALHFDPRNAPTSDTTQAIEAQKSP